MYVARSKSETSREEYRAERYATGIAARAATTAAAAATLTELIA